MAVFLSKGMVKFKGNHLDIIARHRVIPLSEKYCKFNVNTIYFYVLTWRVKDGNFLNSKLHLNKA